MRGNPKPKGPLEPRELEEAALRYLDRFDCSEKKLRMYLGSVIRRRGGDARHVTLDTGVAENVADGSGEILDVHAALEKLALLDARLVRVVEMRYFGGMKDAEIAQALGLTDRTVRRDWEKARLLLANALRD